MGLGGGRCRRGLEEKKRMGLELRTILGRELGGQQEAMRKGKYRSGNVWERQAPHQDANG